MAVERKSKQRRMKVRLLLDRVISSYLVLHCAGSFKLAVYFVYNIIPGSYYYSAIILIHEKYGKIYTV